MRVEDALNYVLFLNPVVSSTTGIVKGAANYMSGYFGEKVVTMPIPQKALWQLARETGPFVRVAALSGAAAAAINAYGYHRQKTMDEDQKRVFDVAARYHFIHTLAVLGMPMCRVPFIAGTFMLSGIILFCGNSYYYALTGNRTYNKVNPIGGMCLIAGWLAMLI